MLPTASTQMAGADFLVGMDWLRSDAAGQLLEPVPTATAQLTAPPHLARIENGSVVINARLLRLLPARRDVPNR